MSRPLASDLGSLLTRLTTCDHVLLGLDFDGTLAPIVPNVAEAAMPPETRSILRCLDASERVSVAILSGRALADLKARVNLDVICCGNHGLEIEGGGISFVHEGAVRLREWMNHACWDLEAAFQGIRGVLVERKDLSATVHHRHAPHFLDDWIEATVRFVLKPYDARLMIRPGLESWEVRPRVAWNKGSALKLLMDRIPVGRLLVICAGDDTTDEDMFHVSPDVLSIQVGGRPSSRACYHVSGPPELREFLEFLRSAILPDRAPIPSAAVP